MSEESGGKCDSEVSMALSRRRESASSDVRECNAAESGPSSGDATEDDRYLLEERSEV